MKKYIFYIFPLITSLFLFLTTPTYALTNYNSQYNISIPNYDEYYSNVSCGNESIKDLLHNFIDNYNDSSSLYHIIIFPDFINSSYYYSQDKLTFFAYKKSKTQYNRFSFYGLSSGNLEIDYAWNVTGNDTTSYSYIVDLDTCTSSISSSSSFQTFLSYLIGNTTINSSNYNSLADLNGHFIRSMDPGSPSADYKRFIKSSANTGFNSFNNTDDYTINDAPWFYWSSRTMSYKAVYTNSDFTQSSNKFYKKLHIVQNDTTYNYEDNLVSYWDIRDTYPNNPPTPTFIGYQTSLNTFYTSISSSNVNNYALSFNFKVPQSLLGFYQDPQEYFDNTTFDYSCSGRKNNNNNYYSYELVDCSLSNSSLLTDDTITYTFNNFTSTSNLSIYDMIFVTISSRYYDNNINRTIYSFNYSYNLGSIINTEYKGDIYDSFSNLPLNFKLYISSNNNVYDSSIYVKKYKLIDYGIKYRGYSTSSNQQNLAIGESILGSSVDVDSSQLDFSKLQVTNSLDTGIMIFQENSSIVLPQLDLFFNNGNILSFNTINNSNNFYYVDSNGDIVNNDIIIKHTTENDDKYDISYYISKINDFIDDLEEDLYQFSTLTQSFYNGMPLIFQTFIFIIFIFFCLYFIYLLIKR